MEFDCQQFRQELQKRKEFVDSCLEQYLSDRDAFPPVIHQAMHYAVFNGGKRLRPILVFEGASLAGGDRSSVVPAACALEMIHSYSLVHDDLPAMDDDDFRRGKPTCHRVYGEANAILTGDALLTRAFAMLAQNRQIPGVDPLRVLRVIEEVSQAAGSRGMVGDRFWIWKVKAKFWMNRAWKPSTASRPGSSLKLRCEPEPCWPVWTKQN
jgi:farnesyl-diphosphate synthase (EC 2.5.1.10)